MGAWIEIGSPGLGDAPGSRSHPTWVRGLKLIKPLHPMTRPTVAPYMGAWIEILPTNLLGWCNDVAPYMGAWIEMCASGGEK